MSSTDNDRDTAAWLNGVNAAARDVLKPGFAAQLIPSSVVEDRLHQALAVLDAISAGALLETLPVEAAAQKRHQTAVSLLGALEVLLREALGELID